MTLQHGEQPKTALLADPPQVALLGIMTVMLRALRHAVCHDACITLQTRALNSVTNPAMAATIPCLPVS
jgi:hypothetical protein